MNIELTLTLCGTISKHEKGARLKTSSETFNLLLKTWKFSVNSVVNTPSLK